MLKEWLENKRVRGEAFGGQLAGFISSSLSPPTPVVRRSSLPLNGTDLMMSTLCIPPGFAYGASGGCVCFIFLGQSGSPAHHTQECLVDLALG